MGFLLVLNWIRDTYVEVLVIAFCEVGYFPESGLQTKQNEHTLFMHADEIKLPCTVVTQNKMCSFVQMPQNRISLKSYHYRPQGRRTIGRPKKRWREQL